MKAIAATELMDDDVVGRGNGQLSLALRMRT